MSGRAGRSTALTDALTAALAAAEHTPRDVAAVALARAYASAMDAGGTDTVVELGPKYLAVLTALGMTPAGRGQKGGPTGAPPAPATKVDELRERRNRKRRGDAAGG